MLNELFSVDVEGLLGRPLLIAEEDECGRA